MDNESFTSQNGDAQVELKTDQAPESSDNVNERPAEGERFPDISAGDMETDLPEPERAETETVAPRAEAEQVDEVAPVAEPETRAPEAEAESPETRTPETEAEAESTTQEIEIPWGEVTLPAAELGEAEIAAAETEAEQEAAEEAAAPSTEAPVAEQPPAPAPIKHAWYVVHCYSGYENKVKKGLEQRILSMAMQEYIFRVVVPVEKEVEIKEGQRRQIERRVFPGYILVEMMELHEGDPVSDQAWYVVRNTPGVTGFVSSGDKPVPLREDEVNKILKRMESEEPKVHVTFRTGQTVHIIDGPFADFRGVVDNVDMVKGKVRVMVSFFGRETPVELDLLQVEKV